ncbi:MAG: tqsA 1, partial [Verrucomicrobiaceae bacterium]|nr:tqsA 1 [Verrucomicrobiaceae bacterium]
GPGIYKWVMAFFSPEKRRRLDTTAEEISKVIFSYVTGQLITSALVTVFAYVVLLVLGVPAPLMLAALAGVFDVLPILGIVLSTIPAVIVAFSVSPQAALIVALAYILYHGLETYVIVPKVYGNTLRLSTLTVLLGLLGGALLAGIPGALAALPVLASYSVIEGLWLKPYLRTGVAEKHERLKDKEFGEKKA